MRVTVLLADAAQAVAGKLYVLGAGWTFIGPEVGPMALGLILEIPWTAANERHKAHVDSRTRMEILPASGPKATPSPSMRSWR